MTILPSSYLPPISYFITIVGAGSGSVIDIGEHYVKRSIRNRMRIMTAQGVVTLTIPVKRANSPRQRMSTIEIDNSKRWQHQHWITITSAYRSSPYFEHFAPYFEPIYRKEWHSLVEFNAALMAVVVRLLALPQELVPTLSTSYIEVKDDSAEVDMRVKGLLDSPDAKGVSEYMQVFYDREPFAPNLSILDLLFCEGTNSLSLLEASLG